MKGKGLSRILLVALVGVTLLLVYRILKGDWEPGTVTSITGIGVEELASTAFSIEGQPAEIIVSTTGSLQSDTLMAAYPWILKRDDRTVVWKLEPGMGERNGGMLITADERLVLDPGEYDVYFASFGNPDSPTSEPEGFIDQVIASFNDEFEKWRTESGKWEVIIRAGSEEAQERIRPEDVSKRPARPAYQIWQSKPGAAVSEFVFATTRPTRLFVQCVGSKRDDSVSGGWIEHVESGTYVWDFRSAHTEHAGGDRSNHICREKLELDRGLFRAVFRSDRQRGYQDWEANPPYDPLSWGMMLAAVSEADLDAVTEFDPFESLPTIVSLTGIGDDALVYYSFQIDEPMRVLIHAVGEGYPHSDETFDYAWLIDDKRRREVWRMTASDTKHAGGAKKNRRAEAVVSLDPGVYTIHYKSDGSHSYEDWNDTPPLAPEHWGVTVFSLNPNFVPSVDPVEPVAPVAGPPIDYGYEYEHDGDPIVSLASLGDYESVEQSFRLESDTKLHIFALGEMTRDGRYDYGWVTNASNGEVVWEMTRENSKKAGGTSKNRKVDTVIELPAGSYVAHYRTDDSHSYPGFKYGGAPNYPEAWGITIWRVAAGD